MSRNWASCKRSRWDQPYQHKPAEISLQLKKTQLPRCNPCGAVIRANATHECRRSCRTARRDGAATASRGSRPSWAWEGSRPTNFRPVPWLLALDRADSNVTGHTGPRYVPVSRPPSEFGKETRGNGTPFLNTRTVTELIPDVTVSSCKLWAWRQVPYTIWNGTHDLIRTEVFHSPGQKEELGIKERKCVIYTEKERAEERLKEKRQKFKKVRR